MKSLGRLSVSAGYSRSVHYTVAVLYTLGTIAQLLRLLLGFSPQDMPFLFDWILVLAPAYAAIGLIVLTRAVEWRGRWEQLLHGLIVIHLVGTAALHTYVIATSSHSALAPFSRRYSYFAVAYFAVFAWRSWTMRLRPHALANAA